MCFLLLQCIERRVFNCTIGLSVSERNCSYRAHFCICYSCSLRYCLYRLLPCNTLAVLLRSAFAMQRVLLLEEICLHWLSRSLDARKSGQTCALDWTSCFFTFGHFFNSCIFGENKVDKVKIWKSSLSNVHGAYIVNLYFIISFESSYL